MIRAKDRAPFCVEAAGPVMLACRVLGGRGLGINLKKSANEWLIRYLGFRSRGMKTTDYIETTKLSLFTHRVHVVVTKVPATVADLNQSARWFQTVGHEVHTVERVQVSRYSLSSVTGQPGTPYTTEGFEVSFKCGARGFVRADGYQELDALVVGQKGYLHGLAVWRKHKHIVGTPTPWFRAQQGARARLNADRAPRCCAAELYARAAGQPWGTC